nr:hypothetical protein ART_00105 [Achromobacter phage vB_Ade_ART]
MIGTHEYADLYEAQYKTRGDILGGVHAGVALLGRVYGGCRGSRVCLSRRIDMSSARMSSLVLIRAGWVLSPLASGLRAAQIEPGIREGTTNPGA